MIFPRKLFLGPGGVRAGWRFLAFLGILITCQAVLTLVSLPIRSQSGVIWEPRKAYLDEIIFLISVLAATLSMAKLERRKFTSYGLPSQNAGAVVEGLVWGTVAITLLVGSIWLLHGYDPGSLNVRGTELVKYLILWGIFMAMVGFTEELAFRGYPLFTLRTGMGFWQAAVVLSLLFGAAHLNKPGENWNDILNIILFGLFLCYAIWRTRALWFAIGFHAAFDFFALYVYSAPNAGQTLPGRLLTASFHGPAWLTGSSLGPEASLLAPLLILLVSIAFAWRHKRAPYDCGHAGGREPGR